MSRGPHDPRFSQEDYQQLHYWRKSGDYPAHGTDAWRQRNALIGRYWRAHPSTRERMAWHEAGHCVAGHGLGGTVLKIVRGTDHWAESHIDDEVLTIEDRDAVRVAGYLAEEMKFGRVDPLEASCVVRRFRKEVKKVKGQAATPQDCLAYVGRLEECAHTILEAHWNSVEAVAQLVLNGLPVYQGLLLAALQDVPRAHSAT